MEHQGSQQAVDRMPGLVASAWMIRLPSRTFISGEDNTEPPNYRVAEWTFKPGGEARGMRMVAEFLPEGHKSSHELRRELEAKLESLGPDGGANHSA